MKKNIIRNFSYSLPFFSNSKLKFETTCVHGHESQVDPFTGSVIQPIYQTSTFCQIAPGENFPADCMYSRYGNPGRSQLERSLAELEGAEHGFVASSGMGATTNIITALCQEGDHVLSIDDIFGGTRELFSNIFENLGVEFTYTDLNGDFENEIEDNTKIVWVESPTNPTLKCTDIRRVCDISHENGALVVVDNTFMSPYFQQPLSLGADVVMHSCTKFLNGHADVVMGVAITNDDDIAEKLYYTTKSVGAAASPFDCWLCARGLRTLPIRMKQAWENSIVIAEYLENHPKIERVLYPGLPSHPNYEIAQKQTSGDGAMITIYLKGGLEQSREFMTNLKVMKLAVSLGGVESLANHPALMTHSGVPESIREELGITNNLVRLSVGIEHIDDLLNDLDKALSFVE